MNKVIMCGRLSKEPDVRVGEKTVGKFSIAVERKMKVEGQPTADFFNCVTFGKQAEFVQKYLSKGTKVNIVGRLQNDNYTNKEGQKVYSVQIYVEEIEFAESKKSENIDNGFMSVPDEGELPFN
jgi:single-strand DNA-binding protein